MKLPAGAPVGCPPIFAILRGVEPDEVAAIAGAIIDAGIRLIEVPLNSPEPLESIRILAETFGADALIGAGTVIDTDSVIAVQRAGGRLVVSPHTDPLVITRSIALGLTAIPGFYTTSEAFCALRAGAKDLKLFPAGVAGPAYLKALREVLPRDCSVWAVGGTHEDNLSEWLASGAVGIGAGASLYRPGLTPGEVGHRARLLVRAWQRQSAAKEL